jgi:hypothetical protein
MPAFQADGIRGRTGDRGVAMFWGDGHGPGSVGSQDGRFDINQNTKLYREAFEASWRDAVAKRQRGKAVERRALTGVKRLGARTMNWWLRYGSAEAANLIIEVTLAVVPEEKA